jgi:hypothetical protein
MEYASGLSAGSILSIFLKTFNIEERRLRFSGSSIVEGVNDGNPLYERVLFTHAGLISHFSSNISNISDSLGIDLSIFPNTLISVAPENNLLPTNISYRVHPKDHMSTFSVYSTSLRNNSGA